ncbi:MAG TPA: acetyl-CoA C-acyltransferase [Candidatus Hydrogenedentes bacterium]|nr:acetyl-CoA C-acyltransferase [Candidatus Hydrogenedentota bacterium]HPG66733.1 acetyl-CoA C-acyltransferase [Candidatus Hydrogenedentota bacterium]
MPFSHDSPVKQRAVIVGGVRTPFLRAFGAFTVMDSIALSVAAVRALLAKTGDIRNDIDGVLWGGAILPSAAPNVGREMVLDLGLPPTIKATTLTRACTSGLMAISEAAATIERGEADVMIAGGSDSTSNAEVTMPPSLVHKAAPVVLSAKSGVRDYFRLLAKISIRRDLLPRRPSVRERTTGELMGEAAERMTRHWGIAREDQDAFALQSHQRAAAAIASGRFADEIITVQTPEGVSVTADDIVRGDTSIEKLAKLRPAFAKNGTLTAGNSSALTDGAAAVLVMAEEKARALGFEPLAAFRSWSYDAVDPADQLLIGPAISIPIALDRAGMTLGDVDIVDIHEAFAAQVLCVLRALASDAFAQKRLGRDKATGELAPDAINIHGGSVALGHPFGATGARMIITMANELKRSGKETALLGICAAGAQSAGVILEAVP